MIRATIMLILGLLILLPLFFFVIYDYYLTITHQVTFSEYCHRLWLAHQTQPIFWVGVGTMVGFTAGLILGFILGHLFWPLIR